MPLTLEPPALVLPPLVLTPDMPPVALELPLAPPFALDEPPVVLDEPPAAPEEPPAALDEPAAPPFSGEPPEAFEPADAAALAPPFVEELELPPLLEQLTSTNKAALPQTRR